MVGAKLMKFKSEMHGTEVSRLSSRRVGVAAAALALLVTGCAIERVEAGPATQRPAAAPAPAATTTESARPVQQARPAPEKKRDNKKDREEKTNKPVDPYAGFKTIKRGAEGPAVTVVQNILKSAGCLPNSFKPDGEFTDSPKSMTYRAIRRGQDELDIKTTGAWDGRTAEAFMNRIGTGKDVCDDPVRSSSRPAAQSAQVASSPPNGCIGGPAGPGIPGTKCPDGTTIGSATSAGCGLVEGPPAVRTLCPDGNIVG